MFTKERSMEFHFTSLSVTSTMSVCRRGYRYVEFAIGCLYRSLRISKSELMEHGYLNRNLVFFFGGKHGNQRTVNRREAGCLIVGNVPGDGEGGSYLG